MHGFLQFSFLIFFSFCIVCFFVSIFFDLIRSFLVLRNSFSLVLVFIELNFKISFFLSLSKCFFQIFKIFVIFALCLFVKIF